jgi:hypothetical protein
LAFPWLDEVEEESFPRFPATRLLEAPEAACVVGVAMRRTTLLP